MSSTNTIRESKGYLKVKEKVITILNKLKEGETLQEEDFLAVTSTDWKVRQEIEKDLKAAGFTHVRWLNRTHNVNAQGQAEDWHLYFYLNFTERSLSGKLDLLKLTMSPNTTIETGIKKFSERSSSDKRKITVKEAYDYYL